MAKNKSKNKNNKQQQSKISPERFMREKARKLPIGKCFITPDWQKDGLAQIIISRIRPDGKIAVGIFLVDTFCVGVKDAVYYTDYTDTEFGEMLQYYKSNLGIEEIGYTEAHNIIYGAISFAEEAGIQPAKKFGIAEYMLEEDTDDVPLIEYEFGKNGKHFLVINEAKTEMHYLNILRNNLGENFEYVIEDENYDEFEGDYNEGSSDHLLSNEDILRGMNKWLGANEESNRHPTEPYSYQYREYPENLVVKHQFITDELLSSDNFDRLPDEVIDRILALPADEAAQDIGNIVLYVIGKTYKSINDGTIGSLDNEVILHSVLLLGQIQSEKSLDAVLELLRQNDDFIEYYLGDWVCEITHYALYSAGRNNVQAIVDYLYQPGLDTLCRTVAVDALAMIVFNHPERRDEIMAIFREFLASMVTRLPKLEACDAHFAGLLISTLIDLNATELIPEIKAVYATDCVDKTIAGSCDSVIRDIKKENEWTKDRYIIPDIHKLYR